MAIEVEVVPPSKATEAATALVDAFNASLIPVERQRMFREQFNLAMGAKIVDLNNQASLVAKKFMKGVSELPDNIGTPESATQFAEVAVATNIMQVVLTGEQNIVGAENFGMVAALTAAVVDPYTGFVISEMTAGTYTNDEGNPDTIGPAEAMETIDRIINSRRDMERYKYGDPKYGPNDAYSKVSVFNSALLENIPGGALHEFRNEMIAKGGVFDERDLQFVFWMGVLEYFAGGEQRKFGMIKSDFLAWFWMSKIFGNFVIQGNAQTEHAYLREQAYRYIIPGRDALGYFTGLMVKGDPNLDPDMTPINADEVARNNAYLLKASKIKAAFPNRNTPATMGRHWGKMVKSIVSLKPEILEAYVAVSPMVGLAEIVKNRTIMPDVPTHIRTALFAELQGIGLEWQRPPRQDRTQLYRPTNTPIYAVEGYLTPKHGLRVGTIDRREVKTQVRSFLGQMPYFKQELVLNSLNGNMEVTNIPLDDKTKIRMLQKIEDKYYDFVIEGGRDSALFILSIMGEFGLNVFSTAIKAVASGK